MSFNKALFSSSRINNYVLMSILFWLPLYRGGYDNQAIALLLLSTSLILVLSLWSGECKSLRPWVMLWFVVLFFLFFQTINFSIFGYSNGLVKSSFDLDSIYVIAFFTSMWVMCWATSQLDAGGLKMLFYSILLVSSFQAVYGLTHFLIDGESVLGLWVKSTSAVGATGTFVNRNHFAGMLAMSWPLVIYSIMAKSPKIFSRLGLSFRLFISFLYSIFVLFALLSSESRMGMAAAAFGLFICALVATRARVESSELEGGLVKPIFLSSIVLIVIFALWFGVEDIAQRYARLDTGDSRLDVWRAMFDLPASAWVFGIGVGSFEDVFYLVQPTYLVKNFDYAHNDYLQFFLEFGIIPGSIILIAFMCFVYRMLPKIPRAQRAGAIGALSAIALHSLVDCNLQIPGAAMIACVAFGLLLNPNLYAEISADDLDLRNRSRQPNRPSRPVPRWLDLLRSD